MKKSTLLFFALLSLTLVACTPSNPSDPESEIRVNSFENCVAAGNPVMESYPRQCRHQDMVFVEDVGHFDPIDEFYPIGEEGFCTREFAPVCGKVQIECANAPCDDLETTFSNRCEAEKAGATQITEGACEDEEINPQGACLSFDGAWLEDAQECEGMDQNQCEALGGNYEDCASACRNTPDAELCTMQCVQVCQF